MACRLAFDGWADYDYEKDRHKEAYALVGDYVCLRKDVKDYLDGFFYDCYKVWSRYKLFGLPHGNGWINEREIVCKVIDVFEQEREKWEVKELKRKNKK